jgi:hypothetical protein
MVKNTKIQCYNARTSMKQPENKIRNLMIVISLLAFAGFSSVIVFMNKSIVDKIQEVTEQELKIPTQQVVVTSKDHGKKIVSESMPDDPPAGEKNLSDEMKTTAGKATPKKIKYELPLESVLLPQ